MLKKILYPASFSTLGVAVLLGLGMPQSGVADSDVPADLMGMNQPAASAIIPDTDMVLPAAEAPVVAKGIQVADLPAAAPAPATAIKHAMTVDRFVIFDATRRKSSRKEFQVTPNGLRKAMAYYERLRDRTRHVVIKALMEKGEWGELSAKNFKAYVESSLVQ